MIRDRGRSVTRRTALGNPFIIGRDGTREEVLARYGVWLPMALETNAAARAQFDALVGLAREGDLTLLCWCAPLPCHAEIIAGAIRERLASLGD